MVLLTDDWPAFQEYSEHCRIGTYQLKEVPEGVEIKILAGRIAFEKTIKYEDKEKLEQDPLYKQISLFLEHHNYIRITGSTSEEQFFL